MSETVQAALVDAIPGALIGIVPIALTAFFEWREERDTAEQQRQAIRLAHSKVSFLETGSKPMKAALLSNC